MKYRGFDPHRKEADEPLWPVFLLFGILLVGGVFVGVVKFLAYWAVAFG